MGFWKAASRKKDLLDDELFKWTKGDAYLVRDLMRSVAVVGATGAGKTSSVAKWFIEAIVRHSRHSLLGLAAKQSDVRDWQKYYRNADRLDDLIVFEPGGPWTFNILNFVQKAGGDARQVTKCLMNIAETLRGNGSGDRDNEGFWVREQERALYNAIVVMKLATGNVSGPLLQEFLTGAPQNPPEMQTEAWKAGKHNDWMRKAYYANKTAIEEQDWKVAKQYFQVELPNMADRTRSSIFVGVFGLLHQFNSGIVASLLSADTNVSPDDMLQNGKSILVNAPPALYGDTGNFINAAWKFATQWAVLRRDAKPDDFFNVVFVDEAQQFVNTFDSDYLAQCRSHLGSMIYLTQSRHSYYAAMPGEAGKHKADALLANFNLKIFNALGDVETATWASDLCGRELKTFYSASLAPGASMWDEINGKSKVSSSFSTQMDKVLEPRVFLSDLRTGGVANRYVVDAVLVKSGEAFSTGKNWMRMSFSQR